MIDIVLIPKGVGYLPAFLIRKSKRKSLVRYRDKKEEWIDNKNIIMVDKKDISWYNRIFRVLKE